VNVLHILSNFRWTERSEPATDLVLAQQAEGTNANLVCGRNRADPLDSVEYRAKLRGVNPLLLDLPKHFEWTTALRDINGLQRLASEHKANVMHCHLENGWLLTSLAICTMRQKPLLIGHIYDPEGLDHSIRSIYLAKRRTDGIIVITESAKKNMIERFNFPEDRIAVIEPGVNIDRFNIPRQNTRAQFGLKDEFVVGMVTAFGRRRRVDIVLNAVSLLAQELPDLRLLLIGRGKIDMLVEVPAKAMRIRDHIILGGYCRDNKLVEAYHAMDVFAYPMPGTDRSCRAVREALTAGVPVVASRIGFLPELVADGETGRVVDATPEGMADAIRKLYHDRKRLTAMSKRAAETSTQRFSPATYAAKTLSFYNKLTN